MKLLLDTHVVLWWRLDSRRLNTAARDAIAKADLVWVSAASGWEVAIKQAFGKIHLMDSFVSLIESSDFSELPVTLRHTTRVGDLPPHHADPFDRMLIAQALAEGATMVTHDRQFAPYGCQIIWS